MFLIQKITKQPLLVLFCLVVFISSIVLGLHNATIYAPNHGFDGSGHVFYLEYLIHNKQIPPANLGWETHQSPLYYIIGAFLMLFTGTWKIAQYINTFVLWFIIGMVGVGIKKVFKNRDQVLIGMYSLAALPMLNIFPAMITNELLSTFWIISTMVSLLFIVSAEKDKELILSLLWFVVSFVLGVWTKISIFALIPTVCIAFILALYQRKNNRAKTFFLMFCAACIAGAFTLPILERGYTGGEHADNIVYVLTAKAEQRPLIFYYRLDWIPKVDMYNAHYYSLLGGAWNSFWNDGQNAITPFIKFHKKAFVLWILGFILFPLWLYGAIYLQKKYRLYGTIVNFFVLSTLVIFVYFNSKGITYSSVRLTYVMGIVLSYALSIAAASKYKLMRKLLFILISIQFITMVSFLWIQSWWHVTK